MANTVRARWCLTRFALVGSLMVAAFHPAMAQAPSPAARNAPALDAARAVFEALPEADRKAIQEGLIWMGDYSGAADGTFGRQTYDAIVAFQQGAKKPANGILNQADRASLQNATQQARSASGFTVIDDPRSGVRLGIPAKILPKQDTNQSGGSRWQSVDDKVTLDTRVAPPDATLQSLYDRNIAIQTPGRLVTYKILRPDFFVITGETPTGKFYTRYAGGTPGIRGFSIGYDKALAPQLDRLVVAIANSFTPFPTAGTAVSASQPATSTPQSPAMPRGTALLGTGIVVAPNQVMTTAPLDSCSNVRIGGLKAQPRKGRFSWLLTVADSAKTTAPLARGAMTDQSALLIVAFADKPSSLAGEAAEALVVVPGLAENDGTFTAALQPGASGAPVLDTSGALVGLVGPMPSAPVKIAGVATATRYKLVPSASLVEDFAGLPPAKAEAARKHSAADLAAAMRAVTVPILCGP
ncbi:peptidoglycan-binding protein [Microvirga alba]|uniref:Peptidoglycan-binding protein n=1 Tax=Microvirga alba TaxID=2791025 RepID=A0A931FRY1_9HYPH|nr:peptidoglycan-binding protein [Microvirga alba]MBF9235028.1 peptidoglycan-binding protein [Microvirga alba]